MKLTRRQFLGLGTVALGGWLLRRAGNVAAQLNLTPTPLPSPTPNPSTTEPREYFVSLDDYHELPPECYQPNLIRPSEIIVHNDGNRQERKLWVTPITYETLKLLQLSAHFAVDYKRTWQLLPMHRTVVQESHGAFGYNKISINIEMAGRDFDEPDNYPLESQIDRTVRLTAQLMDFYAISFEHVVGHFERDPRGLKKDPGLRFMADFRERLNIYRTHADPLTRERLVYP